jgi:hypothetical protein
MIPRWLFFVVALWVISFGVFRIFVALKKRRQLASEPAPDRPNFQKRGLYALSPRSHILFGVVYLLLGACLIAMGFGWQPQVGFAACREPAAESSPPSPFPGG